jgi:hypothetical protein
MKVGKTSIKLKTPMGKLFKDSEMHLDQEVLFFYEGEEYCWTGHYEVKQCGEESDWDYCGDSEVEVEIETTKSVTKFNEQTNGWDEVAPTNSLIYEVILHIERNL